MRRVRCAGQAGVASARSRASRMRRAELEQLRASARDALLLELREHLFGAKLRKRTPCPRCRQEVEARVRNA